MSRWRRLGDAALGRVREARVALRARARVFVLRDDHAARGRKAQPGGVCVAPLWDARRGRRIDGDMKDPARALRGGIPRAGAAHPPRPRFAASSARLVLHRPPTREAPAGKGCQQKRQVVL